jgi:hypothetical protein
VHYQHVIRRGKFDYGRKVNVQLETDVGQERGRDHGRKADRQDPIAVGRLFENPAAPMVCMAPPLFSTTMRQPSLWASSLAAIRLIVSGGVPVAPATTTRIMFDGLAVPGARMRQYLMRAAKARPESDDTVLARSCRLGHAPGLRGGRSSLKGRKVAVKYRDKSGNTWAGRGAQPVWLREKLKAGAKLEDFAVYKTAASRKASSKRRRRAKR